ncbi:MAG: DUF1592 domain-containing protein [Planctomycetaceae bacterium]
MSQFLQRNCRDCHSGAEAEAGFDIDRLSADFSDRAAASRWTRLYDRVAAGEMPPDEDSHLSDQDRDKFVTSARAWLLTQQRNVDSQLGRVRGRRLTRREVERSLQDLLGVDIPLVDQLPEESQSAQFSTVADGQSISHFQLERHLGAVDAALDEAFRRALALKPDEYVRDFDAEGVARVNPKRRCREPEMREGRAVVWSSGLIYYGRLPATTAKMDGWYRFQVTASGLKLPKSGGVWCTINTGLCVSSAPLLSYVSAFEAQVEPQTIEFVAWLPKGHMLEIRPGDTTLRKARFNGGQVGVGEGEPQDVPGIAIDRITMERIHLGPDDDGVRQRLFDSVPLIKSRQGDRLQPQPERSRHAMVELLTAFASRAFRRPVTEEELSSYIELAEKTREANGGLTAALRVGYRAILCSPRFLYLQEQTGSLDQYALATRLSYFLTGSTPDAELLALAKAGQLHHSQTLRQQTDRLLAGQGGRRFVEDVAAEWLDLKLISFTEPDRRLFPEFDAIVQNTMLDETHSYLELMLRENRSIKELIDSDYTFLNSRLARYYDVEKISGDKLRQVSLPNASHRGGLLTQGSILKVTSNGNNTSPVVRGIWVSERLLGVEIPPPPGGIPAIEPDIRGAKTIREQLEKHKSQESCSVCHRLIDPPGYALENFDPAGQWRDKYLQVSGGKRNRGLTVDPSYQMADGRPFENIDSFKKLVLDDTDQLAGNVASQFLVYGTGAPISFADREAIREIVESASHEGYGLKSIVHAVVTHPVFQNK